VNPTQHWLGAIEVPLSPTMASGFNNELISRGALEAAQEGTVSADDAQRIMLDESQKAGSTALHFDPNASPEEKAAQAKAVSRTQAVVFSF